MRRKDCINKILIIILSILIFFTTVFMNLRNNADRYARGSDFKTRLYYTYTAFAMFSPSITNKIERDVVPYVIEKYAVTYKQKLYIALLHSNFGYNYFLPFSVLSLSVYLGKFLGFTEINSFSWWLMIGFSGYFVLGVCAFVWGLTKTKNWLFLFLAYLSVLPYSLYGIFQRFIGRWVEFDFCWIYYEHYAPRSVLTLLLLSMVILINKKELQRYVIPLSTIVTFWHCAQSLIPNGLLLTILLVALLVNKLLETQRNFKKFLHYLKDILPYPSKKLIIAISINIVLAIVYLSFYSYDLKYIITHYKSFLPKGDIATFVQYTLYVLIYCKIIIEIVMAYKTDLRETSVYNINFVDIAHINRILFTCLGLFLGLFILALFSKFVFPLLGGRGLSLSVKNWASFRYALTISQTAVFGFFLASFLVFKKVYIVTNKYGKIILIIAVLCGIGFINYKSWNYFVNHRSRVLSSHRNLVNTLGKLDQALVKDKLNIQKTDVFFWNIIKDNFLQQKNDK